VTAILAPPLPLAPGGRQRRVGVEIEYAGVNSADAADLVAALFGGAVEARDAHRHCVAGTRFGDFVLELDMSAAHPKDGAGEVEKVLRSALGTVGSVLLPFEIATPPVPFDRLGELDPLLGRLAAAGASGTRSNPLNAFGLHLNPELPRFDAGYIASVMKAYALLAPWLEDVIGVDAARRIAPFIQPWPDAYRARLVDPGYWPGLERLAADYVAANPSRNRELDLWPLLVHLGVADSRDENVKPRPTWHYRLPDSRVGEPQWSVVPDWNRWVAVERLAADRARLDAMGRDLAARLLAA
jgi:hypothetical protein